MYLYLRAVEPLPANHVSELIVGRPLLRCGRPYGGVSTYSCSRDSPWGVQR